MEPVEKAAKDILAIIEATYQANHDYVVVEAKSFGHLDLTFYERTAKVLSVEGFRRLADIEDRTITNTPKTVLMPVMVRAMLSKDGTTMASLYHPKMKSIIVRFLLWVLGKLPAKVVDMETEFDDGSFVITSNAAVAAAMDLPSLISAAYLPTSISVLGVLQRHTTRVAAHLSARPGVHARKFSTLDELLASQNRMNAIKAAFRGEVGGITKAELDRLAILGKSLTGEVHAAVVRQQARRAS